MASILLLLLLLWKRDWFVGLDNWIVGLVDLIDENAAPAPMLRSTSRSELNSGAGAPLAKYYSWTATLMVKNQIVEAACGSFAAPPQPPAPF